MPPLLRAAQLQPDVTVGEAESDDEDGEAGDGEVRPPCCAAVLVGMPMCAFPAVCLRQNGGGSPEVWWQGQWARREPCMYA